MCNVQIYRLLLLATLLAATSQLSLPSDSSYMAGVVEHPEATGTPKERLNQVTSSYVEILESNDTSDLDILVFPEYTLNSETMATFVPHPDRQVTPCFATDYEQFLVELSCATRSRGIYVLLNVVEKELCGRGFGSDTLNPCPADGVRYFNTNVVLDRRGRVVSRYRKTHLWRREYNSRAVLRRPDLATFDTDFGVTFGHFICFDMLFYEPAMRLLLEHNVTDIIYPTYWFSELPFLTALQLQEGWAYANNVNLLAADGSQPATRTSGSGIYAGRAGRLAAIIQEQPQRQLLKARVPKHTGDPVQLPAQVVPVFEPQLVTARHTGLATFRDYNLDIFASDLLEPQFSNVTRHLCHGDFCCSFQLLRRPVPGFVAASHVAYRYRLGAYCGNETTLISVDRSEQAVCAIFACLDEQLASCGRIFPAGVALANEFYFERVRVEGMFPGAERRLIMPSTVDGAMMPLNVAQFNWNESPPNEPLAETQVLLELVLPKNDLLTFGIWANYFSQLPSSHNLNHLQAGNSTTTGGAVGGAGGSVALVALLASCLLSFAFAL